MSSSKKIVLQRAGVYLSEAQSPISSPLHTACVGLYLFTQGTGGGGGGVS
jgi:hypothetical protein